MLLVVQVKVKGVQVRLFCAQISFSSPVVTLCTAGFCEAVYCIHVECVLSENAYQ
jgi:hypothetical protein